MRLLRRLSILLTLSGCATVTTALGGTLTVEDAELAGLSGEARAELEPLQTREQEAAVELGHRTDALNDAEREVAIAQWTVRQAEAGLKIAELRFDKAQATKDADAMLPAREARDAASHALAVARAEHVLRQAMEDHVDARVDEAEAAGEVATAELQLARLNAVLEAKEAPTADEAERRSNFEKQVSDRKSTLAKESAAVAEAEATVHQAEADLETAKTGVPPRDPPVDDTKPAGEGAAEAATGGVDP